MHIYVGTFFLYTTESHERITKRKQLHTFPAWVQDRSNLVKRDFKTWRVEWPILTPLLLPGQKSDNKIKLNTYTFILYCGHRFMRST